LDDHAAAVDDHDGPAVGGSFADNFKNFVVMGLFQQRRPPISGMIRPVGHTDILVTCILLGSPSAAGTGADTGLCRLRSRWRSFWFWSVITDFQFRYTNSARGALRECLRVTAGRPAGVVVAALAC
jgi:hypothetical protein